ncbi:MAG TPA: CHAD domain-containing protein [Sulfuricaulis sp.]|nr:CHAD domain-containing protein [Sulfuricaulis sp.]
MATKPDASTKPISARLRGWQSEPAGDVAIRLAHRYLDAAGEAAERVTSNADPEALHDFRVALRRLRSVLRAYRCCLRKLPKKWRRQLKRVVRATNAGRDSEVFLAWLDIQSSLPVTEQAAHEWLRKQLEAMRDASYSQLRTQGLTDFIALSRHLRQVLAVSRSKSSYGEVMADHLHAQTARVAADLARVHSAADAEAIHDARIQAKRLRYLIEPSSPRLPGARAGVKRLKTFQDEAGALCDGFVRRRMFVQLAEAAGAQQAREAIETVDEERSKVPNELDVIPGLRRLAQRSERQVRQLFQRFRRRYLETRIQNLIEPFLRLERRLAGPGAD